LFSSQEPVTLLSARLRAFSFSGELDHADLHLLGATGQEDLEALVPTDEVARRLVPHQGLDAAELLHAPRELLVLAVGGLEVLAGVVRGGVDAAGVDRLDVHDRVPLRAEG
jgi:hypothetical protein